MVGGKWEERPALALAPYPRPPPSIAHPLCYLSSPHNVDRVETSDQASDTEGKAEVHPPRRHSPGKGHSQKARKVSMLVRPSLLYTDA